MIYHGLEVMGGGSILAGLILGAIGVFIIERDFMKASAFALAGAVMTYFGFMHGEAVGIGGGFGVTPGVAFAYAVMAAACTRWAGPARARTTARIRICRRHLRSRAVTSPSPRACGERVGVRAVSARTVRDVLAENPLTRNPRFARISTSRQAGRGKGANNAFYYPPLTAPAVSPATICRCANTVSSSTGSVTISAAAASGPQLSWSNEIML